MLKQKKSPPTADGESEFRRRLAIKLAARGYCGPELEAKIEELLRKGVKLRLDVEDIVGRA